MTIYFFLLTLTIFLASALAIISLLSSRDPRGDQFQTLMNGIKTGLRECGFQFEKRSHPVELYQLEIFDDEDVCDECLEASKWQPMDIADWMKEGFPRNPSRFSKCGGECRCELMINEKIKQKTNPHN